MDEEAVANTLLYWNYWR